MPEDQEPYDVFARDTPADTLRAVAAAWILCLDGMKVGGEFRYEGPGFVATLQKTGTQH